MKKELTDKFVLKQVIFRTSTFFSYESKIWMRFIIISRRKIFFLIPQQHPRTIHRYFEMLQYLLFSIFKFEILWFLVYLTILALIAVSLLLFTLICAAIVRLNYENKNLFSASNGTHEIGIKRCGIFLHIFWYVWKVCRIMSTYSNAHAKIKNWIFDVQFPGNWFGFSIILHDFWSSTICAIRIQFSFAQFKNPKNPGIQPTYGRKTMTKYIC